MKLNFCTLFNSSYLSRGVAMYESLQRYCSDFHLYVFAFDEVSCNYLRSKRFPNMTVVSLKEFEDAELLKVKPTRSAGEYCWTCTSSTILYSIKAFKLSNCTYLDADMQFFADPAVLINEMGNASVLITEHRYTKAYDQSAESGKYCVQFVTFKNDERGMKVLEWWRDRCIEWCYSYAEEGKFGDQKYLDDWTRRFEGVHELQHLGGGIAPWNVQQYDFEKEGQKIFGIEKSSGKKFQVIFFHFHGVKFFEEGIVSYSHALYDLDKKVQELFYRPYVKELVRISKPIGSFNANGSAGKAPLKPLSALLLLKFYVGGLRKSWKNLPGQNVKKHVDHHYYYYVNKL
jgi:hypothetical protein